MSVTTPPEPVNERRHGRFASEMMAGGSVVITSENINVGSGGTVIGSGAITFTQPGGGITGRSHAGLQMGAGL